MGKNCDWSGYYHWRLIQLPSGIWRADGRGNITRTRYSLGTRDRSEALTNLTMLDRKIAAQNGEAPESVMPEVQQGQQLTFEDARKRFIDENQVRVELEQLSPRTLTKYRQGLERFGRYCAGQSKFSLASFRPELLTRFCTWLIKEDYARTTIYFNWVVLTMFSRFLINAKQLPKSFRMPEGPPRPTTTTTYCFSLKEIQAILRLARRIKEPRWLLPLIAILAYTGARISEALSLRWKDVDLQGGWILLEDERFDERKRRAGTARRLKNRDSRVLCVPEELASILAKLQGADEHFVVADESGGEITYAEAARVFKAEVLEKLSPKFPGKTSGEKTFADGRFHSFRHAFCSLGASRGMSDRMMMGALGHADSAMVKRYFHPLREELKRTLSGLSLQG